MRRELSVFSETPLPGQPDDIRQPEQSPNQAITVIIPTKDEALHIARCIDSSRPLGRVVVVDANSSDNTVAIARTRGVHVYQHEWEGYAGQKNWALDTVELGTDWVLFLDADEYITEENRQKIREAITSTDVAGFYLPRRNIFLGRELRHAWWYPDFQLRLFRAGHARYEERQVHEHMVVDGPTEELRADIMHENLKGIAAFIDRHNRYSDLEADEIISPSGDRRPGSLFGSWSDRRRALKERVWFRLPLRPLIRFIWLFFLKRGFLDGRQGFVYCSLIAGYDFLINIKVLERRLNQRLKET